jgi:tetratricopeptide (TPR) repeat protein
MGSTGRRDLARLVLGGVARRVLRDLPCSIWSARPEGLAEELFDEDLRYIQLLLAEGREFLRAGENRHALLKFRRVLGCNPFHAEALQALAECYERLGHHAAAEGSRRRAEKVRQTAAVCVPEAPAAAGAT